MGCCYCLLLRACACPSGRDPAAPRAAGGAPHAAELQAEGQGIADAFLVLAGWETALLRRAPLFRGYVSCRSGVQLGDEKGPWGTGRLGTEGEVA